MDYKNLLVNEVVDNLITTWLIEDTPSFDYGGFVVGDTIGESVILCKSKGFLCGKPYVDAIFKKLDCSITWNFDEGVLLEPICTVAKVTGKVKDILRAERVVLNVLARASGVATVCKQMQEIKVNCDWSGEIAGTRKTTPGFRNVEKYALLVGGCSTHRYDLSSMVMLKDNHIWITGSITKAVTKARKACGFSSKIEVECRSVNEALEACSAGADIVMLDNFHASVTETSAKEIKSAYPNVIIEVSGGMNATNMSSYMTPNVDVISASCLTQGYKAVDFSMKILKDGHDPSNPMVKESYK